MSVRANAESLRQIPLFKDCESVPLQVLAFAAERQMFARGDKIITEGLGADCAYFLLEGQATLRQAGEVIGRAEAGALLGEIAMLGQSAYAVTAIADGQVSAAVIDQPLFQRVVREYPEFGQTVLAALSEKLGRSMRELDAIRATLARGL